MNQQLSFQDFRDKISIQQIADLLGYKHNKSGGVAYYDMILGDFKNPTDEIIIYNPNNPSKSTYFSRQTGKGGNLINFVEAHLNELNATQTGFKGVNEVLNKFLGNDLNVKQILSTIEPVKTHRFNLEYWKPSNIQDCSVLYLKNRRHLSSRTIDDFATRCHIYTVGTNKHVGFPFRKPGSMEITNFEMRNYFASNNQNYKGFCTGGDKSTSCWIANFCDYKDITDLYLFESAIDAMSFYELKGFTRDTTSGFVSFGGYVSQSQIDALVKAFPSVKFHLCYDNDAMGQCFDFVTIYSLHGKICKACTIPTPDKTGKVIRITTDQTVQTFPSETFQSRDYLKSTEKHDIQKPKNRKDWNEQLSSSKNFDIDRTDYGPVIVALSAFKSNLNLNGYSTLVDIIELNQDKIVSTLFSGKAYCLEQTKILSSSCKDFLADLELKLEAKSINYNLSRPRVIEKTTQQVKSASPIMDFFQKQNLDIFKSFHRDQLDSFFRQQALKIGDKEYCISSSVKEYMVNILPSINKFDNALEI